MGHIYKLWKREECRGHRTQPKTQINIPPGCWFFLEWTWIYLEHGIAYRLRAQALETETEDLNPGLSNICCVALVKLLSFSAPQLLICGKASSHWM